MYAFPDLSYAKPPSTDVDVIVDVSLWYAVSSTARNERRSKPPYVPIAAMADVWALMSTHFE